MKKIKCCPLCGNSLDPKIHIRDFGKTPEELAVAQKELLIRAMKDMYWEQPETAWIGASLVSMLEDVQDKIDKVAGKERIGSEDE